MRRDSVFVLLLATGLVLGGGHAARAAGAQSQADKQTQAVDQPAKTEQPQAAAAQAPPDAVQDQTGTAPDQTGDGKLTPVPGGKALGMSILGNQDAPKSLVIVPWKSSELGGSPGVSLTLDDSRDPVDKDVFMRALRYHEIRSGTTRQDGATGGSR